MIQHNLPLAVASLGGVIVFILTPLIIALIRRHPERGTIARLTVFAMFSVILWGALLTWALSDKRDDGVISKYVARLRGRKQLPLVIGALVVVGVVGSAMTLLH